MKPASLTKPLAIVMLGIPGAGKSFFARQFSETFGAPVVSYDRIGYELFADPQFTKEEQLIIKNIAHYQVEELVKTKKTVLIDGGANGRMERAELSRIIKQAGYNVLLIWVQTDLATSRQRALKRNPQKRDDQYNKALPKEVFERMMQAVAPPSNAEKYMVISGKHTYATQARMVLRKLAVPREDALESAPVRQVSISQAGRGNDEPPRPIPPTRRSVTVR